VYHLIILGTFISATKSDKKILVLMKCRVVIKFLSSVIFFSSIFNIHLTLFNRKRYTRSFSCKYPVNLENINNVPP